MLPTDSNQFNNVEARFTQNLYIVIIVIKLRPSFKLDYLKYNHHTNGKGDAKLNVLDRETLVYRINVLC